MKNKWTLSLFIAVILCLFLPQNQIVQAEGNFSNLDVTVSTDKESYDVGDEIVYTLDIANLVGSKGKDIVVTTTLPEGLVVESTDAELIDNKLVWDINSIEEFGSVIVSFTAKVTEATPTAPPIDPEIEDPKEDEKEEKNEDKKEQQKDDAQDEAPIVVEKVGNDKDGASKDKDPSLSPQTGDSTNLMIYIVALILSILVMFIAYRELKKKRLKKEVTFLVVLAMLIPSFSLANAEEQKEIIEKTHKIVIDGEEYELTTTVEAVLDVDTTLMLKASRSFGFSTLKWNAVEGAGYQVKRGLTPSNLDVIAENVTQNSYVDESSKADETYYYLVTAQKDGKEMYRSTLVMVKPFVDRDEDGIADEEEAVYQTDADNPDTDGDLLKDGEEVYIHQTNPIKKDTDEDGLSDDYELNVTKTDPNLVDTDNNGTSDANEDVDQDTLSNQKEQELNTDPYKDDTDLDDITDQVEINKGTDPTKYDTDEDNLSDSQEVPLGFDPTKQDTDGNGIIDGNEVIPVQTEPNKFNTNEFVVPSVTIHSAAEDGMSTTITSLEGDAVLNDQIPGYIGPAYEFNSDVQFSNAEMTFTYDESVVSEDFKPEIFYYNEDLKRLERLENQVHNPENNTVTTTVEHFSKYILLNGQKWDEVWEKEIRPPDLDDSGKVKNLDVVFSIDSSGSMSSMDPQELRKYATKNFVDALRDTDRSAVVDFDDDGRITIDLTIEKEKVKMKIDEIDSSGGTNLYDGIKTAVDAFDEQSKDHTKYVIFLTDGDGYWNEDALEYAKQEGVIIYTIGLGNGVNRTLLERIATETQGKYYFATDANQLDEVLKDTAGDTVDYTKDEDLDGIPDYLEEGGLLRSGEGKTFFDNTKDTDGDGLMDGAQDIDSDGDGLNDGEEMTTFYDEIDDKIYFKMFSDPLLVDSDRDGLNDKDEKQDERMKYNITAKHSLMFSKLSYVDLEGNIASGVYYVPAMAYQPDDKGAEIRSHFPRKYADPVSELTGWNLIAADDNDAFTGFSAIALQHTSSNEIVIAYRGSDSFEDKTDLITDWLFTNVAGNLFGAFDDQANKAVEFAAEVILDNPDSKIYVTGHSLGGWLAQIASYRLQENTVDEIYSDLPWNEKKKEKIESALNDGNYVLTRTFNAAPFFGPNALHDLGSDIATSVTPVVPWATVNGDNYNSKVYNHQMSFDILHVIDHYMDAEKLGKEFGAYDYDGKDYNDFDYEFLTKITKLYEDEKWDYSETYWDLLLYQYKLTFKDFLDELAETDTQIAKEKEEFFDAAGEAAEAHSLNNFYDYLHDIRVNEGI
ncbi:VWA domain-containing protein [Metabacillus litoralis]|uniref:VWA domain-containing protein n=1 Tax=Metabacillus litoralis TaxID=152268 RepID=A0A5C6VZT4_9BACI|nr:VWA domain-containing protein [Metabacillus litoralis]TXC90913.1 VWA domain-containing protein [Metabacillus litoralis]